MRKLINSHKALANRAQRFRDEGQTILAHFTQRKADKLARRIEAASNNRQQSDATRRKA